MFDHVGIAVSDLAASERFYRTVLSVLGAEPGHADAELVEWDDWDIGPTDREHPVSRGLHVGFRARDRAQVDAFWQAGVDAGYRDDGGREHAIRLLDGYADTKAADVQALDVRWTPRLPIVADQDNKNSA